ncbi:sigma-70 family RNA polymerase sigma factor [Actinobacteria bacterium YIM 96077]|uniref:RNA polymerase subunit sigma n=2 Tax=Phytoactinopolyspora halophila TaxID=1981511 RepID=A0A329R215_9ACTN|nr:sigma-70 family RNA polymerase sigma factor [Actinobacteria bacterium YIM 96077]RAW18610.1 RNA polymerase subunit sigma [Phytoactinopolyspora halophila]
MLFGVAYRLLGSATDADDVLQDAYLRWRDVATAEVREPRRYLTRIVTRLALDRLRARGRHESYVGPWLPEPVTTETLAPDPAETAERRDSAATATLYLMERLDPVERAVFVLRAAFEVPYADIAEIVERDAAHCRQLFHRARDRLADDRRRFAPSRQDHSQLLEHFVQAARRGDLAGLRKVLHDGVVAWSDGGGKASAARNAVIGVEKVARFFAGIYGPDRDVDLEAREINGSPGLVVRGPGRFHVLTFAVSGDVISAVFLVSNPDKLERFGTGPTDAGGR